MTVKGTKGSLCYGLAGALVCAPVSGARAAKLVPYRDAITQRGGALALEQHTYDTYTARSLGPYGAHGGHSDTAILARPVSPSLDLLIYQMFTRLVGWCRLGRAAERMDRP